MGRSAEEKRKFRAQKKTLIEAEETREQFIIAAKAEKEKTLKLITLCLLILIVGIASFFAATRFNPDSDSFWLIETGRWIIENKRVPEINPWTDVAIGNDGKFCRYICHNYDVFSIFC